MLPQLNRFMIYRCLASKGKDVSPIAEDAGEFDEDEFIDLDGDEFQEDEAEDVVAALGLGEDDAAPGISTGGTVWGEAGFKAAEKVQ